MVLFLIDWVSDAVNFLEFSYSYFASLCNSGIASPPNLTGRDSRMRSLSEHKYLPVIAGIKLKRITSPNGFNKSPRDGIVRIKQVSFPLKPPTKAEYADCGSDSAIMESNFNCLIQSSTRDFAYETLNTSLPITATRCPFPSHVTFTLLPMKTLTALL